MSVTASIALLRLAPLLLSTATLTFAHDHDLFFRAFLAPRLTSQSTAIIPPFVDTYMARGGLTIFTLYPSTLILALVNARSVGFWYGLGAAFTVGHFLYAKWAITLLENMRGEKTGRGREHMRDWVRMNAIRTMTVDAAGWVCYLIAVLRVMRS